MKKIIEGTFVEMDGNLCEGCCPLGLRRKGNTYNSDLCELVELSLGIDFYARPDEYHCRHNFIGKKVKITIEVNDSELGEKGE